MSSKELVPLVSSIKMSYDIQVAQGHTQRQEQDGRAKQIERVPHVRVGGQFIRLTADLLNVKSEREDNTRDAEAECWK